jgi:glucokinase
VRLAGDIGGTKTNLALFDWRSDRVEPERQRTFYSKDYGSFDDILAEFLKSPEADSPLPSIRAAAFGVAGPVIRNRCQATNLPWVVDGASLAARFTLPTVRLLNDLEATAYGLLVLRPDEIEVLNAGSPPESPTTMALIAAGTGLGEAILFSHRSHYHPMPSEGGHASFAPTNDLEIELLRYLRSSHLHVSWERVLSGPGLVNIYEFLRDTKKNEPTWVAERLKAGDPAAVIAEVGLAKGAEICVQALELLASMYGAEAGNLALKALSLSGLYVGGGVAPKLLPLLKAGGFMRAFVDKGRYKRLLSGVPVRVIMNEKTALLGAASAAARMLEESES